MAGRKPLGGALRGKVSELLTPASIQSLLAQHGLRPSRALGQNFLCDPNTARRIVRLAGVTADERVVEVGPGLGSLTLALCEAGANVTAVELDQYLRPVLSTVTRGLNVDVVAGDALDIDWSALLTEPPYSMVANLPYNIATPMLMRAVEIAPMIDRYRVMVQREVGERLAAPPGSRVYGAVSVRLAYWCEAKVVGIVPPTVFIPRPNVESALVQVIRRPSPAVDVPDRQRLFALIHAGFATRRKSLRQSLRSVLGARTDAVLSEASIAPMSRAEALGIDEFAALALADAVVPQ